MLIYIFKSAACMAIFFVFYKFLLERENMHVFKRFYLLLAIGVSLLIPALVFTEYVIVEPVEYATVQPSAVSDFDYIGVPKALENDVLDIEPILWTIYFFGFTFFGLKFIKNLDQIIGRIRKNPKQKSASFIQVLLKENFPPHTFFKYIFLNKKKLESNEIPREVLLHEETHAKQKHSWDVIFIELLQVIFWFNPLVYLFKKSIKLNHEFLADQAVLDKDIDKTTYQNTLLSYLSPDSQNKYQSKMANAINYSSIKKRFTVMKTHTSKKAMLLRSLLLLPLLALLLLGFSETQLIEVNKLNTSVIEEKASHQELTGYNELAKKYNAISIEKRKIHLSDLMILENAFRKMSEEQKANSQPFPECLPKNIQEGASRELMKEYNALAKKYNTMLSKSKSIQIKMKDVERLEYIHGLMSEKQRADAEPFPDFPEPPPPPKAPKAPKESKAPKVKKGEKSKIPAPPSASNLSDVAYAEKVIEETIANQDPYDHGPVSHIFLKGGDSKIPTYSLPPEASRIKKGAQSEQNDWVISSGANRSSRQDQEAMPFPPVAPTIAIHANTDSYSKELNNAIQEYLKKNKVYEEAVDRYLNKGKGNRQNLWNTYNSAMELYVNYYNLAQEEGNFVQPIPAYKNRSEAKKGSNSVPRVLKGEASDVPPPPAPPEPQSPLDHVIEMAKKGATFYYEDKKVTSDKAIELLKNNKSLNIDSRGSKSKRPVVKISKAPIAIEN